MAAGTQLLCTRFANVSHDKAPLSMLAIPSPLPEEGDAQIVQFSSNDAIDEQARLSVAMPRSLYKKLKLIAHDSDMTVSSFVIKLIRTELS